VPPAEEEGEGTVEEAVAAAKAEPAKEPAAERNRRPGAQARRRQPAAGRRSTTPKVEERDLAAFLEKHKGKSPEELAALAFQQTQARQQVRSSRTGRSTRRFRKSAERATARSPKRKNLLATRAPSGRRSSARS
jgi:hypothetical protein